MKNFTIKEAAAQLRVSSKTILREISRGKITPHKAGRRYLISEAELTRYTQSGTDAIEKQITKFLHQKKPAMVTLLQKLISLPSVTNEAEQEENLAKFIYDYFKKHDIRTNLYSQGSGVAVRASLGLKDTGILLDCPLDTTPAGEEEKWTHPPFEGVVEKGKMYGRGTADCKAGMVCMIFTALALKKNANEEDFRLEIIFDGGEQDGTYKGIKLALKKGIPARAGIIGYAGSGNEVGIGARGYHRYELTSKGKSVHTGSRSKSGENAISNMAKLICEIDQLKFEKPENKMFSFGSKITVSQITGGTAINVVPDMCSVRLDIRTVPDVKKAQIDKKLKSLIASLKERLHGADFELKYLVGQDAFILDDASKFAQTLKKTIKEKTQSTARPVVYGPANIGNLLYKKGIDMYVWGPKGGNVHGYDEYVELDSLVSTAQVYANTVLNYFK